MVVLKKSYRKKKISINKVKTFEKEKTKKLKKQRTKSQKGLGQQGSFLDRLLGPNEMVFMGDPQCNLKDCCFSLQKEQDEESVIQGLQDQNKSLKDELEKIKRNFQEQNKILGKFQEDNISAINKLKEYLVEGKIIQIIEDKWKWSEKFNNIIIKLSEIKKKKNKSFDFISDSFFKENLNYQDLSSQYNQKLINAIKPKLQEVMNINTDVTKKEEKEKICLNLTKNIMLLGKQINKDLQQINIVYHNGKKFNSPNL